MFINISLLMLGYIRRSCRCLINDSPFLVSMLRRKGFVGLFFLCNKSSVWRNSTSSASCKQTIHGQLWKTCPAAFRTAEYVKETGHRERCTKQETSALPEKHSKGQLRRRRGSEKKKKKTINTAGSSRCADQSRGAIRSAFIAGDR